jgi:uncharacterized protein YjbI with pentapeptide repeats
MHRIFALFATIAVVVALVLPQSAKATDRVNWYGQMNPISTWWNLSQRYQRIGDGSFWWNAFGANTSWAGTFDNLSITPASGLTVTVGPTSSSFPGTLYAIGVNDTANYPNPQPSGVSVPSLPADSTQFVLQATTSSTTTVSVYAGTSSGQSIINLIECKPYTNDQTATTINLITSTGTSLGTASVNRDRKDSLSCTSVQSASSISPTVPSVTSGYVPIGYVTVPYGSSSVTTGMITSYATFQGFALANASGAIALDTSSTGQTKAGSLSFSGGTLSGVTVSGGTISGTTTNSGTISGGTVSGATLSGTTTNSGTISGGTVSGATLSGSTLSGTTTNGGTISGGTVSGATLSGTTTNSGTITGGTLGSATLSGTLSGGTLSGSTLTGTTTNSGTISGGTISGATLSGTTTNSGTISGGTISGLASALTVGNGGTGQTSFPSGYYLVGNGTGGISSTATIPTSALSGIPVGGVIVNSDASIAGQIFTPASGTSSGTLETITLPNYGTWFVEFNAICNNANLGCQFYLTQGSCTLSTFQSEAAGTNTGGSWNGSNAISTRASCSASGNQTIGTGIYTQYNGAGASYQNGYYISVRATRTS